MKPLTHMQKALAINPADSAVLSSLAGALMAKGRFDDAAARLRTALRLHPEVAALHSNLGLALSYGGRLDDAIEEYRGEPRSSIPIPPKPTRTWAPRWQQKGASKRR